MIVQDIMTESPTSITETARIVDAMSTMAERGIRHLPVVRDHRVVGILSDRDFNTLGLTVVEDTESYEELRSRMGQAVSGLMTGGVVTIGQDAQVSEAVDLMLDEKLSALPVIETGTQRLVGIVSYVDVLRAARDLLDEA